jgi:Tol biopolymer transport system component
MDATVDQTMPAAADAPARPLASQTTLRIDWILTALSIWLVGGFYIDLWAHAHGRVDDTFFTPWHGLLYSGAASFGVVLGAAAVMGRPRSVPILDTLAPPYRVAFLGSILFAVAGVLDLAWHTAFGFEVDVEALLSPTHLLLATSGVLMVGGPIRAAGARLLTGVPRTWRTAGPVAIPLAMALAILVAFTQYVNPIVDVWAEALPGDLAPIRPQLYAMATDGSGQRRLTVLPGEALTPRFSPDGTQIAYSYQPHVAADGQDPRSELHVMAADGTRDRVLATEAAAFQPAWSPDGTRLVFSQNVDGQDDLFVMTLDGTALEQLTNDTASDWAAVWTPDGGAILFNSDRDGTFHIHRFDVATKAITAVTAGDANDYEPAISPDGSRIAFTSDRRGTDHYDVWLSGIDGSAPTRLTTGPDEDVGDSYMATWSPDGSRIAFASNRSRDFEVYVQPVSGGEAMNVSQSPGSSDGWARSDWSPDGATIVYPSQDNEPFWQTDYIRQGFGAAGVLVGATLLAGGVVWLRRRYGALPLGAYAVVIGAPLALATVLDDQYRLIPAIVVAALVAELVVRRWAPGRSRVGDGIVAFLVPAIVFALYFATLMMTTGLGWTIHLWLGAIFTAGIIGLFLDELTRAVRRPSNEAIGTAAAGLG